MAFHKSSTAIPPSVKEETIDSEETNVNKLVAKDNGFRSVTSLTCPPRIKVECDQENDIGSDLGLNIKKENDNFSSMPIKSESVESVVIGEEISSVLIGGEKTSSVVIGCSDDKYYTKGWTAHSEVDIKDDIDMQDTVTNRVSGETNSMKSHVCHICKKLYKSTTILKIHLLIHKKRKPYKCKVCGKSSLKLCEAIKHLKSVHKITFTDTEDDGIKLQLKFIKTNKIYECKICNIKFLRLRSFTVHNKFHRIKKTYTCDTCSQTYSRRHYLIQHIIRKVCHKHMPHTCDVLYVKRYLQIIIILNNIQLSMII